MGRQARKGRKNVAVASEFSKGDSVESQQPDVTARPEVSEPELPWRGEVSFEDVGVTVTISG